MALITTLIPAQNFEIIRDQIALILGVELANQGILDNTFVVPTIAVERIVAVDKTALPLINVCLNKGNYESQTALKQNGSYTYTIDVYTDSPAIGITEADKLSKVTMERIIGMCRTILQNFNYKTLGYPAGTITNGYAGIEYVSVTGFALTDNNYVPDALASVLGRLFLQVKCPEGSPLGVGNLFQIGDTTITIGNGPNGYQLEISGS